MSVSAAQGKGKGRGPQPMPAFPEAVCTKYPPSTVSTLRCGPGGLHGGPRTGQRVRSSM